MISERTSRPHDCSGAGAMSRPCTQYGLAALLLILLATPLSADDFQPFTQAQINERRAQLYQERDNAQREADEAAARVTARNEELKALSIRERALIDAGVRRVK